MNFALNVSQKVEAYMQELFGDGDDVVIGEKEEADMYQQSLSRVLKEDPLAWAEGNIRVGEIILIVDSDTRVVSAF